MSIISKHADLYRYERGSKWSGFDTMRMTLGYLSGITPSTTMRLNRFRARGILLAMVLIADPRGRRLADVSGTIQAASRNPSC